MGCVPWCQTIFTLFSSSGGAGWAISNLTGVSFRKMCNFRDLDLSRPELTDRGYLLLRAAAALQNRNRRQNHEDSGISCVFASSLSLHFWLCSWVLLLLTRSRSILVSKIGADSRVTRTWASHVDSGRPHIVPTSVQSETARPIQIGYKLKGNFFPFLVQF